MLGSIGRRGVEIGALAGLTLAGGRKESLAFDRDGVIWVFLLPT
jgi:hypothetical protein